MNSGEATARFWLALLPPPLHFFQEAEFADRQLHLLFPDPDLAGDEIDRQTRMADLHQAQLITCRASRHGVDSRQKKHQAKYA